MQKTVSDAEQINRRLDRIIQLLEDIFILEATAAGIKNVELRKIRGVAMERVTRITRQLEK
jgi:hypothetical protein